jgi:hypothetical protein
MGGVARLPVDVADLTETDHPVVVLPLATTMNLFTLLPFALVAGGFNIHTCGEWALDSRRGPNSVKVS